MYLKNLELFGFKSFSKKSVLQFNASISAIVGPNGSGKSNIAEAFRFVLGEQSIKSLRGKRGEDLIFNGSKSAGRQNRASVKVVFDNSKRLLPVDFDEVSIERVVYRDSSNEYLINGSQVRLKDILELLSSAHVGASGHHIISQGEADKILSVNARERKVMIEEALGLKIYQYKKQESQKRLVKTEENIASADALRKEIQPHLRFLKKQAEKIERAIDMREQLKAMYQEYFKREYLYIETNKQKIAHERSAPKEDMQRLERELSLAKDVLSKKENDTKEASEIISLENRLREVRTKKDELSRELGRIEGGIFSEERRIKTHEELSQSDAGRSVPLHEVAALSDTLSMHLKTIETESDVSTIRTIIAKARALLSDFVAKNRSSEYTGYEALIDASKEEILRLRQEKEKVEKEITHQDSVEKKLQQEYQSLRELIEKEKDSERDAEKEVFRIVAAQNEIRIKLNQLAATEENILAEEGNFKRELTEAGVLAGREAVDYEKYTIVDAEGTPVSDETVAREARGAQEERRRALEKIKIRLEDQGIGSADEVMKEYKEVTERDVFLQREIEDLEHSAASLRELIAELEEKLATEFKEGILKINKQFQEFFSGMFGGGVAELVLVKEKKKKRNDTDLSIDDMEIESAQEEDEEETQMHEDGVEITVSLPHKKIKGLVMLSGGERALTSIALLFAVSQVNPPPFIILDETDAALDEANSRKYGAMIKNLSQYSQLILITHNRETMSAAGILYGVTMGSDGISKLLSIEFEEAVRVAK